MLILVILIGKNSFITDLLCTKLFGFDIDYAPYLKISIDKEHIKKEDLDYLNNIKEITKLKADDKCPNCDGKITENKSIEVGNIFDQGIKYSEALGLDFADETGNKKPVIMGAYGIGLGRVMATAIEIHHDDRGIIWPEEIAPFKVHLISLDGKNEEAGKVYNDLQKKGIEVLFDDREDKAPGEKFADADLIGCPIRLVISNKTLAQNSIELKYRNKKEFELVKLDKLTEAL